ncbi:DUF427 domain-containing protein [uncultured Nitratireductor sp.]|uniref:DUF427 domain-containing protein n=1 Tax=uncultured Nitratireductor sp. TaxID=520953 RepID=UPI0025DA1E63|nr:DUF427 domain-containing protein [uncultured Nitratireductor sp.]
MNDNRNPAPGFERNPDKSIVIRPHGKKVCVRANGIDIAVTESAKRLRESGLPDVIYIPFEDINFASLERTQTRTHCPYKGDATYWRLTGAGEPGSDIMWAYEAPFDEALDIKEHGAFFAERVEFEES